ncbi:hypothetical protein AVEN_76944-1 [Araneus ventricosus]|uniref:Uncharacterized protein n=1 Tax=Araneus ventricosus TaxID=182803 RepID=A0A4Y2FJ58_ARAVE|nr:hypothetical protein AVEN_76944-1 [Araneus ventricosus]
MGGVCRLNYDLATATTILTGSTSSRPPTLTLLIPGHAISKQSSACSHHSLHFTDPTGPHKRHRPHWATQTSPTTLGHSNITDPTRSLKHHWPGKATQYYPNNIFLFLIFGIGF